MRTTSIKRFAKLHWSSVLVIAALSSLSTPALAGRPDIFDLQSHLKQMSDSARGSQMQAISPVKAAPAQRLPDQSGARPQR
jgi:hypothetical protein